MKKGCLVLFILIIFCISIYSISADEGITKAVPTNFKTKCEEKFIGEPFCEKNAVHQMYQNGVCYKYDKITRTCTNKEICNNGNCVLKGTENTITGQAIKENAITGEVVKEVESKGIISRIIDWIKSLF